MCVHIVLTSNVLTDLLSTPLSISLQVICSCLIVNHVAKSISGHNFTIRNRINNTFVVHVHTLSSQNLTKAVLCAGNDLIIMGKWVR